MNTFNYFGNLINSLNMNLSHEQIAKLYQLQYSDGKYLFELFHVLANSKSHVINFENSEFSTVMVLFSMLKEHGYDKFVQYITTKPKRSVWAMDDLHDYKEVKLGKLRYFTNANARPEPITGIAKCGKCHSNKIYILGSAQTRAADEPTTVFYQCAEANCGYKWSV